MRHLWTAVFFLAGASGCATPRVHVAGVEVPRDSEDWRALYEQEALRTEALALRLAEMESLLERVGQERAEADRYARWREEDLGRSQVEQHALEEHNAQLSARQRELTALHQELSNLWYSSALSRARRRSLPPGTATPIEPELKGAP